MTRTILLPIALLTACAAHAQFVWPKAEYHNAEPGLYKEDPFVVKYRQKFFSVFRGDFKTFNEAFAEIEQIVKKDPKDARAIVWLGNGQTVRAGILLGKGQMEDSAKLVSESRKTLDRAVALKPEDPNIYMMRAATLYIQGQYWPEASIPRSNWERLRDDCEKFIRYIGPDKMPKVSIHLRGEAYGELGIAYAKLGNKEKARKAFETLIRVNPGTDYAKRAQSEIEKLTSPPAG
jgi:tetratricopeptide (TPR) repeat protein